MFTPKAPKEEEKEVPAFLIVRDEQRAKADQEIQAAKDTIVADTDAARAALAVQQSRQSA